MVGRVFAASVMRASSYRTYEGLKPISPPHMSSPKDRFVPYL